MGFATQEQAAAIFEAIKERDEERAARMPDFQAALSQASIARERLQSLGWREGIYCPKDGSDFALVEWGSTGIHRGYYMGKWPDGHVYCGDFLMRPEGMMFKLIENLTPHEVGALVESDRDTSEFIDRMGRLAAIDET